MDTTCTRCGATKGTYLSAMLGSWVCDKVVPCQRRVERAAAKAAKEAAT